MGGSLLLLGVIAVYAVFVLAIALFVENNPSWRLKVEHSPIIYALSLAVYNSTWSFYGSVGLAARSGFMFLPINLGVLLSAVLWWVVLRRMVRVKTRRGVTSIADFVSSRYDNSQGVAVAVTLLALFGSLPYVALQMRAILTTLRVAAIPMDGTGAPPPDFLLDLTGPLLVAFTCLFTILVGVRRPDSTERHQGMVAAVAVESVVKLVALMAVGAYVTWVMNDGVGDLFSWASASPGSVQTGIGDGRGAAYMQWTSLMILSMWAVLFLPRQFHVAVVENSDERHIRTAMWLFPLYALLLQVFVMPIALGGLAAGLPASQADTFVLRLPIMNGARWLGGLAFIGGLSAGMSMIVVSAMTMATMITNHIVLPLAETMPRFRSLRRFILPCRWMVVVVYLNLGYGFHLILGETYLLVNMGVISFVAVLQFAPAVVGGLFWRGGGSRGALAGLGCGFLVWLHTLLVPAFARSGLLPVSILADGPLGIGILRPEALFGLQALEPLTHAVFWSLVFNTAAYVGVSLLGGGGRTDSALLDEDEAFAPLARSAGRDRWEAHILLAEKREMLADLFADYYSRPKAEDLAGQCVASARLLGRERVNIGQLMDLYAEAERLLAGVVGTAAAYKAMRASELYSPKETMELSELYAELLSELKLDPGDLAKHINYYEERELLLTRHAAELLQANRKLREEVQERRRAEEETRQAEGKYRGIFEKALEGIFQSTSDGRVVSANPAMARFLGYDEPEALVREVTDAASQLYADPGRRLELLAELERKGRVEGFEIRFLRRDGSTRWGALYAHCVRGEDGKLALIEGILEDIEERKQAKERIIQANRYVQDVIDSMPSIMVAVDGQGRVTNWNRVAADELGVDEASKGRPLPELCPDLAQVMEPLSLALETGSPQSLEKMVCGCGGSMRYRDVMIYPLSSGGGDELVVRIDDVTDRVRMEEMMVQTEKMMSVGGLAAGMAHEINNPLGGILQGVQNILRRLDPGFPANEKAAAEEGCTLDQVRGYLGRRKILPMVEGIRDSGMRAAGIVANMLDFSRRNEAGRSSVDVNALLDNVLTLAATDYDMKKSYDFKNIRIERDYAADLPLVVCARSEIEQVLLNLLRNAAQAMFASPAPDREPVIRLSTLRYGDGVRILVADNGPGMDEATRKRVFEPFFTTKDAGQGTGLGLSVSFFIITSKHGGNFSVDSAPGQGATFTIHLPLDLPPEAEA